MSTRPKRNTAANAEKIIADDLKRRARLTEEERIAEDEDSEDVPYDERNYSDEQSESMSDGDESASY